MKQKQYDLKNALSIACDIFDKQGYIKEAEPTKNLETNKSILSKRLENESEFTHSDVENVLNYKQELVFKKLSGKLSDYEHLVIKILEKQLEKKVNEFKKIVKVVRTHLQDATPLTLGQ